MSEDRSRAEDRSDQKTPSEEGVGFFLLGALVCLLLVPVAEPHLRWVPEATAAVYVVLAVLVAVDVRGQAATPVGWVVVGRSAQLVGWGLQSSREARFTWIWVSRSASATATPC